MLLTADETLPIVIAWTLAWLAVVGLFVLPRAIRVSRDQVRNVWSPSMLQELTDERELPGEMLPSRCPIRIASASDRLRSPDSGGHRTRTDLSGWQSDGR